MKREIKFRAWDKKHKLMFYDVQDIYDDNETADTFGGLLVNDDFEVMQFTGLKDKKGKEIYEKDIIRLPDGNKGTVIFEKGIFYHTAHSEINGMPYWHEVIGNIYEILNYYDWFKKSGN